MVLYLGLVAVLCAAVFLVALRSAQWLGTRRDLTADVATGLFMMTFMLGLVLVAAFVVLGANLTETSHMAIGLFVQSVLATVFFPLGILLLKKKQDFS